MATEHTDLQSIAFVSDWQKRSSWKQMAFNTVLILALAAALLTKATFFYWSKGENHEQVMDHNMKYLQVCGIQEADRVEDALEEGVVMISNIARRYTTMNRMLPDTSVMERLELLVDFQLFDRIGHVSAQDNRIIGIQGTGLGMPIARNIVRMMNGDIRVESELDKGSCFTVTFMLKLQQRDEENADRESAEETDDLAADFTGRRVLLVEDNELNREIAMEILSMLGLEIETADNGVEALAAFAASEPGYYDLISMDVQMPVMNGYEATGAIRASSHPEAETVPIVAMTANAFSTDVRAAREAGMNGHIAKPIDVGTIVKMLNEQLR